MLKAHTRTLVRCCVLLSLQLAASPPVPAQSTPQWTWDLPTQADEQAFYTNVMNWAWTASDKNVEFSATYTGYDSPGTDIHDSPEGDDCWTHYHQFRRTGLAVFNNWATGWCTEYFRPGHYLSDLNSSDAQFDYDHLYGEGLVLWAHFNGDAAALTAATNIAALIESEHTGDTPGTEAMAYWGPRKNARQLLVAVYVAQETQSARWINLRNLLIDDWVMSTDWQTGAQGGMFFSSEETMRAFTSGKLDEGDYDAGYRIASAFQTGVLTEALWRAYLATGRSDIRSKLVGMAQWVNHYAHDPTWVNPMAGAIIGQAPNLSRWHRDGDSGDTNVKGTDPAYDTALVNTLVIGYKLTGDATMLAKAKALFRQGTRFSPGAPSEGPPVTALVPMNEVHHFIDTMNSPDAIFFEYNKGELRYCYLLFENGGNPIVMGNVVRPASPANLTVN